MSDAIGSLLVVLIVLKGLAFYRVATGLTELEYRRVLRDESTERTP